MIEADAEQRAFARRARFPGDGCGVAASVREPVIAAHAALFVTHGGGECRESEQEEWTRGHRPRTLIGVRPQFRAFTESGNGEPEPNSRHSERRAGAVRALRRSSRLPSPSA